LKYLFITCDGSDWDSTQTYALIKIIDHAIVRAILPYLTTGLHPAHENYLFENALTEGLKINYSKKGVHLSLRTSWFTASGVCDRTNLNFLRQYILHTCGHFIQNVPLNHEDNPHFSTGDDGLRIVEEAHAEEGVDWLNTLYTSKKEINPIGIIETTTGWLRKG
jgi:hypothetical protein